MPRILLVDDEAQVLKVLSSVLKTRGHEIKTASDGEEALDILSRESFDLMISDIRMKPMDGLALLKMAQKTGSGMPTIMLTAHASVESAIDSLKFGAFDYLTKPFNVAELLETIDRALAYRDSLKDAEGKSAARTEISQASFYLDSIIAESAAMKAVCEMVKRLAPTETTVSIVGEPGTGKGLIAKSLHKLSARKEKQFQQINCATTPEPILESELFGFSQGAFAGANFSKKGLFEQADGGTLYMEEIGSLPGKLQAELLAVLQERKLRRMGSETFIPVNVRLIVSSNIGIEQLVKSGLFHEDLYYRLNVVSIQTTPLRERKDDILPLFDYFLKKHSEDSSARLLTLEAEEILKAYTWPGNTEELENTVRHILADPSSKKEINRAMLPKRILTTPATAHPSSDQPMRAKALMNFLKTQGDTTHVPLLDQEMERDSEK